MAVKRYGLPLVAGSVLFLSACGGGGGQSPSSTADLSSSAATTSAEAGTNDTQPPVLSSPSVANMQENHTVVMHVEAQDDQSLVLHYSIAGGVDASLFHIYASSGILVFRSNPDFENPADSDGDNLYHVNIKVEDSAGNSVQQELNVTLTDIAEEGNIGDSDGDLIPDNVEILLGMDSTESDEDGDQTVDGLQSSGSFGDAFFDMQWHLRDAYARVTNGSNVATEGLEGVTDLDIVQVYGNYMGYNSGDPILVQVVDTGVDADHEDLVENMDLSRSYRGGVPGDPSGSDPHGTMVAGIITSRALNGKGVRGVIPFAKIAGSNWLEDQNLETLTKVWLSGEGANEIAVSNNSWGSYFDTDTDYEAIMKQGTEKLRDGKGRIYLFAAGNDRAEKGNANLQYVLNNRFAIAVTGVKNDNTYADYATPGANILISAYSGNYTDDSPTIGTTTVMGRAGSSTTWSGDTQGNYTYIMNGTSAATPMAAGAIALILEACPDLTWRDIRYLAATTARKIDDANGEWITNAAGLHFNINYGFGLINPKGMIDACTNGYKNLSQEDNFVASKSFDVTVPDDGSVAEFVLNMGNDVTVEWVELIIDNDNPHASDYRVELVSPQGTRVTMMTEDTRNGYFYVNYGNWMDGGFRLSTAAMLDENGKGDWKVEISDKITDNIGTVKSLQLYIYGH